MDILSFYFPKNCPKDLMYETVVATLQPEMIKPEDAVEMQGWKMGRIWIINNMSVVFWIIQLLIYLTIRFLVVWNYKVLIV